MDKEKLINEILYKFSCGYHGKEDICNYQIGKKCAEVNCNMRSELEEIVDKYLPDKKTKQNKEKMIKRIARIICECDELDCLCPDPQRFACTSYNKARDIVNIIFTKEKK